MRHLKELVHQPSAHADIKDQQHQISRRSYAVEIVSLCGTYGLIEEEANRWPADLIVIGTHGRRGIRRVFLGSVAEGVARISSKPVLLIRGG